MFFGKSRTKRYYLFIINFIECKTLKGFGLLSLLWTIIHIYYYILIDSIVITGKMQPLPCDLGFKSSNVFFFFF